MQRKRLLVTVLCSTALVRTGPPSLARSTSVLAWGRNVEGQCGVENRVVVANPTQLLELLPVEITSLAAGRWNSGATSQDGVAWTWGCGRAGKLGHGSAEQMSAPCEVESLVGRADVASLSLGESHTLVLDSQGRVWSCGENKEGQCGLGTPLGVLAQQHRQAYFDSLRLSSGANTRHHHHHHSGHHQHHHTGHSSHWQPPHSHMHGQPRHVRGQRGERERGRQEQVHITYLKKMLALEEQQSGSVGVRTTGGGSVAAVLLGEAGLQGSQPLTTSLALGFGGMSMEGHLQQAQPQPGHFYTPVRVGHDTRHIMGLYPYSPPPTAFTSPFTAHPSSSTSSITTPATSWVGLSGSSAMMPDMNPDAVEELMACGLDSQEVMCVSASSYFSLVVTKSGEVWTFGADYNGALGSHSSWSTAAQRIAGPLAELISEHGGAVAAAAGGSFCAALCADGKAVVWGQVPHGNGMRVQAGLVGEGRSEPLPPLTLVSAGMQHVLFSDGVRVWVVGRWLDAEGKEAGQAPWSAPHQILDLGEQGGVAALVCGAHSSAAVGHDGRLWMWGRLLDRTHVESLNRKNKDPRMQAPKLRVSADDMCWSWGGYGSATPQLVEGLAGVRAAALGGWHALVACS